MGKVLEFMRVSRKYIRFNGKAGEKLNEQVDILPVYSFRITSVTADPGKNIRVKYATESRDNQPYYRLTIENTAKKAVTYLEKVVVRTDSDIRREFIIPVNGVIM